MKKLLIFTDTYKEQVNGVTRCLDNLILNLSTDTEIVIVSTDDFLSVPFLGYKEIRLSLAFPRQISKKIKEVQPDFIHIVTEWPIGLTAALICRYKKIPYTTSFHTKFPEYLCMRNRLLKEEYVHKYLQYIHGWAETILISNTWLEQYLNRNWYRRFGIVPLGINHDFFYPGEKHLFIERNYPILLFVGRVAIEKNIEAFLRIDTKYTKIVVGEGPLLEEYQKEYPEVFFLWLKTWEELGEIYRSADIFVFPSKTDTLGLVNLEAMACGLPVIAYDIENTRAVIEHGKTGILVPEDENLDTGIEAALKIHSSDCIAYAKQFTWQEYARKFMEYQVEINKD
jgi:glycosyltransferase involved in cell wall biosynthesis